MTMGRRNFAGNKAAYRVIDFMYHDYRHARKNYSQVLEKVLMEVGSDSTGSPNFGSVMII